jgi:hypothetical protein
VPLGSLAVVAGSLAVVAGIYSPAVVAGSPAGSLAYSVVNSLHLSS